MSKIDKALTAATIVKLGTECWGIYQDKKKDARERDEKIKKLEDEVKSLKEENERLKKGSQ